MTPAKSHSRQSQLNTTTDGGAAFDQRIVAMVYLSFFDDVKSRVGFDHVQGDQVSGGSDSLEDVVRFALGNSDSGLGACAIDIARITAVDIPAHVDRRLLVGIAVEILEGVVHDVSDAAHVVDVVWSVEPDVVVFEELLLRLVQVSQSDEN